MNGNFESKGFKVLPSRRSDYILSSETGLPAQKLYELIHSLLEDVIVKNIEDEPIAFGLKVWKHSAAPQSKVFRAEKHRREHYAGNPAEDMDNDAGNVRESLDEKVDTKETETEINETHKQKTRLLSRPSLPHPGSWLKRSRISNSVAGWLALYSKQTPLAQATLQATNLLKISHDSWKNRFVVFDTNDLVLEFYKTASQSLKRRRKLTIPVSKIISVEAFAIPGSSFSTLFSFDLDYLDDNNQKGSVRIKAIEDGDMEMVARWVALLLYHTKNYDSYLDERRALIDRGVSILQNQYRRIRALRNESEDVAASGYASWLSSELHSSSRQVRSYLLSFFQTRHSKDLDGSQSGKESVQKRNYIHRSYSEAPIISQLSDNRWVRPLEKDEVEDEVWENQRWSLITLKNGHIKRGWSSDGLLPSERRAVSDRIGHTIANSVDLINDLPIPNNWEISLPFTVDLSGIADAKCDPSGWMYETHFTALNRRLASGRPRGQVSARWVVRHRRWFRRRRRSLKHIETSRRPSWLCWFGWLGMKGVGFSGSWDSRFFFVGLPVGISESNAEYLRLGGFSVGFIGFFKEDRTPGLGFDGTMDWASVSRRDVRVMPLDADCSVDKSPSSLFYPGLFHLHLSYENKPRALNCSSSTELDELTSALCKVIEKSKPRNEAVEILKQDINVFCSPGSQPNQLRLNNQISKTQPKREKQLYMHRKSMHLTSSDLVKSYIKGKFSRRAAPYFSNAGEVSTSFQNVMDSSTDIERTASSRRTQLDFDDESEQKSEGSQSLYFEKLEHDILELDINGATSAEVVNIIFISDDYSNWSYGKDRFQDVKRTPWVNEGRQRSTSYRMPRNGAIPETNVTIETKLVHACSPNYQVDQEIQSLGVPYGKYFVTLMRYIITPSSEASGGCHISVSHEVKFVAETVMRSFVRSFCRKEVRSVHQKSWGPRVIEYVDLLKNGVNGAAERAPDFELGNALKDGLVDMEVSMKVDDLVKIVFFSDDFRNDFFDRAKLLVVKRLNWDKHQRKGSKETIEYTTPIKHNLTQTIRMTCEMLQSFPGKGYEIEQHHEVTNQERGTSSPLKLLFQLSALSPDFMKTRLVVSGVVPRSSKNPIVSLLVLGSKRRKHFFFKSKTTLLESFFADVWVPLLRDSLKKVSSERKVEAEPVDLEVKLASLRKATQLWHQNLFYFLFVALTLCAALLSFHELFSDIAVYWNEHD